MFRKPRNMAKDRLVSFKILSYSYLQAGILEAGSGSNPNSFCVPMRSNTHSLIRNGVLLLDVLDPRLPSEYARFHRRNVLPGWRARLPREWRILRK